MITAGSRIGPYEVLAPVGAGGMGEVWRARDQRLHREVAIKVIPDLMAKVPEALARFELEARAVAALSHPNILAIHDFGRDGEVAYAVMELLEGATLRERLNQSSLGVSRALDWAHQIAQGLAAAHERGIVHRDLKPENIFITRDGLVKILDFGLARLETPDQPEEKTLIVRTQPGAIVGTIGYLSPEQARGEGADARSDIFAFGSVFYEMLSGEGAFMRASMADTLVAVLREEPKALADYGRSVPADIEEIVRHCLEKNRDDRFRSARDLSFALRLAIRGGSGPAVETPSRSTPRPTGSGSRPGTARSIAVLPFRNISSAQETEYFSDGMTEEIINSISNIPMLKVAARTSSFAFKGREDDIRRIGRELGVDMVVEGSVRQAGSRLRVSAQLIDVESGYQVWSERWDREVTDVFAVQDEIAQAIAATFKLRLVPAEEGTQTGKTQNVEAYDRYLKGRYLLAGRRAKEAIAEFQAAIENDPDFFDAWDALADGWAIRGYYGGVPTWEAWARGAAAVDEAERIAPEAAGIPLSRAILEHYYGWNTEREMKLCRMAIERSPKSAEGWNWLGLCLAVLGRTKEALEATATGIELEPYHDNVRTSAAWASLIIGDYETAERTLSKAIELSPNALYARWSRGIALRSLGRLGESIGIFEQLAETSSRMPFYVALLGSALAQAGEHSKAEEILSELLERRQNHDYVASLDLAGVHCALGDRDGALSALEAAYEERNALLWARIYFPEYLVLRDHPRWITLARRLGRTAPVEIPRRAR